MTEADRHRRALQLLWGPGQRPSRGPKPSLTLAGIVAAAIAVADAEGLGAVSMQRVAADVGVTKMAMYRYVPGKSELTTLMIDAAIGDPPEVDESGDWRQRLRAWALLLWDGFTAHPWLVGATVGLRPMGPCELGWMNAGVAALSEVGLTGAERMDTVVLVIGHLRSLAQQTLPLTPAEAGVSEAELLGQIAETVRAQPDRFAAILAAIGDPRGATDDALEFGLARILDGVAAFVAERTG